MRDIDKETADRALAALAATPDTDMVAVIRGAIGVVSQAWAVYRADPAYPSRTDPTRALADSRGAAVVASVKAMRAVSHDDLPGAVAAAGPVLDAFFVPGQSPLEQILFEAVATLRWAAKRRPAHVQDARTITRHQPQSLTARSAGREPGRPRGRTGPAGLPGRLAGL